MNAIELESRVDWIKDHVSKNFGVLFSLFTSPEIFNKHDTYDYTKLFLQRPVQLQNLTLSQWFCAAAKLDDWNLKQAASLGDCKQQLIDKCYVYLPLEIFEEFNKQALKNGGR